MTWWLIWSIEHGKWWKPNKLGYTSSREEAGRYSFAQAQAIVIDANINIAGGQDDPPNEAMVPE